MKILQQLVQDDSTLIFTENPKEDIKKVIELYNSDDRNGYMGYEEPILIDFEFLGNKYKAISFWHDNEDVRDIELSPLLDQ